MKRTLIIALSVFVLCLAATISIVKVKEGEKSQETKTTNRANSGSRSSQVKEAKRSSKRETIKRIHVRFSPDKFSFAEDGKG